MSTWGGLKGWEIKEIKLKDSYTVNFLREACLGKDVERVVNKKWWIKDGWY